MSEQGWMEPAEVPDDCVGWGGLNWSAWRITDAGRAALAAAKH